MDHTEDAEGPAASAAGLTEAALEVIWVPEDREVQWVQEDQEDLWDLADRTTDLPIAEAVCRDAFASLWRRSV